jgi:hypothetical protein
MQAVLEEYFKYSLAVRRAPTPGVRMLAVTQVERLITPSSGCPRLQQKVYALIAFAQKAA